MKLLSINTTANIGSTGRIAEQIGVAVMERGGESYLAYGVSSANSKSTLISVVSKREYRLHRALSKYTDMQGRFSTIPTLRLVKKIEQIAPDIIHLHNLHGNYINYKVLFDYLRKSDIPVVWTFHDCWPMTGHCPHFVYVGCDKWKTGCYDCPRQKEYPKSKFFDRSRKNYIEKRDIFTSVKKLTIVPVSKWLGSIVRESFLGECKVEVIYNGVDVNIFRPIADNNIRERYNIPSNKKIILGVATAWSERKGLNDFIELYDLLPKREGYQIVLVGLSPTQQKALPSGIIGVSRTENVEELAQWYSTADVFVNLSYAETFGLTTAEALASGTPAIVYNNTASPELITTEVGRVVENGGVEAVSLAVKELCAENREELRNHCRKYAVEHFDKHKCFERYLKLYEKLTIVK